MSEQPFFSFRKPPDWSRGIACQLESLEEGLSIVREKVYRNLGHYQLAHPGLTASIKDTVIDRSGRWFMLDSEHAIWRMELGGRHMESIIKLEEIDGRKPLGIAVSGDSVVVLYEGAGSLMQAMLLDRAQIRWTTKEWYGESFRAQHIASDDDGGLLVIGTIGEEEQLQLLRFDESGAPALRIPLPMLPAAVADDDAADDSCGRFHLTLGDGLQGWLLDRRSQLLVQLDLYTNRASLVPLPQELEQNDMLSLCFGGDGLLWVLQRTRGNEASHALLALSDKAEIVKKGYTGNAEGGVLFAGKQALYLWNAGQRTVYTILPVAEPAVWSSFGNRMGIWMSDALDSGETETEWHKLVLAASRQNDTQINIRYYASDRRELFIGGEHTDLDVYIRNADILPETKLAALSAIWSQPLKDPHDALLHGAKGRYIWLFIELIGSSKHAPVVHSLEVYFPRQSYLAYLPSIYQRDERSSDFLSRYLSLFQTMLEQTEEKIQGVTRTLEAKHAQGSSLRWLLGWLGIDAEDYWSEEQLRKLLKAAPTLYSMRGTKAAMETLIQIYTGEKPIILEYEQVKPLKENAELGEVADRLYGADPHAFNVLVKAEHADTETKRVTLQALIEAYKPVFAQCKLIILQPWVYMDLHSYLGMNTVLSEPTLMQLDGKSSMPHHTITIDVGQDNRMDKHTRLGLNSRLE